MKKYLLLSATLGLVFLAVGALAAMGRGGPQEDVVAMGHDLIIAGAIIIAAVLVSFAILENGHK